ncbi:MAG: TauD/TfdA family dioxygenase [Chitinophagales bacterium]|nr:TauD/TfdA family dioxygenase [Chitinophagales bacterium]
MEVANIRTAGVSTSFEGTQPLPLIVKPMGVDKSIEALEAWMQLNQGQVKEWLKKYGAIIFRDFKIEGAADFERIAKLVNPDLKNNYLGTSPRNAITEYVFSASELPEYYPIMQHCEMSFLHNPPANLFFYCNVAPEKDGETPVVNFRKVYDQLDTAIREEFVKKGIKTIRNYSGPSQSNADKRQLKRWDEMFGTRDVKEVEQICMDNLIQYEWLPDDALRLINEQEATIVHPETGEKVWFNHVQVFHLAAAAIEYKFIHKRQRNRRSLKYRYLTALLGWWKKLTANPMEQAMHCTFRDGSPIPDAYVAHLQKVIWDNMCFVPWKKGDLLAIDNYSTSHGRMPYTGPREIFVCWSAATLPAGYHYGGK